MEDELGLDLEFKRYLQILRPYLAQLTNDDVITICNAWICRLSECNEQDKNLRNKYVFTLCYQLAKGNLEDPFLTLPPSGNLLPLNESIDSGESSTEIECMVVNGDDRTTTDVIYKKQSPLSETEYLSQGNEYENTTNSVIEANRTMTSSTSKPSRKQTVLCYTCPEMLMNYTKFPNDLYEDRAKNLIKKLREIKNENVLLHNELIALKEESNSKCDYSEDEITKVDHSTSAYVKQNESSATLKSLKFKLQEVQESRNNLIEKIASLQEQIDNFNAIKNNDIEDIEAKHKLEMINIKSAVKEEAKATYDRKLEEIKSDNEAKLRDLQKQIQGLKSENDTVIEDKNKTISLKEIEVKQLKNQIDDLKSHLHSVLENFVSNSSANYNGDTSKFKAEQLEKKLNKMEKNKIKSTRVYEAKLAQMQREKHLAECSLQLQMVRQRAQVVNEVTDENQAELVTALDKLETKYKEIVANVQATAIQRRMQDQMSLESILQAACGIPADNLNSQGTNQFSKTMRNQNRSYDNEISPLIHCNKGNNVGGNKSFGDDSQVIGYCLNGERMGELFERVYLPQRDNSEAK